MENRKSNLSSFVVLVCGAIMFLGSCTTEESNSEINEVLKDIDGNIYHTVTIGTQTWMVENLKVTKYSNGDLIGTTTPVTLDITGEASPKYQWAYEGNEDNVEKYGRLYTWNVIVDSRGICPDGWRIPTDEDWTILEIYMQKNGFRYDGTNVEATASSNDNKIAKALAATSDWYSPNETEDGAIGNTDYSVYRNLSGFTAYPAGGRNLEDVVFEFMGKYTHFWSSTQSDASYAWSRELGYDNSSIFRFASEKYKGFSVRCIKE